MNEINLAVPFFSQREILYKYQSKENTKDFFYIAAVACNITSLCMLLNYLGITEDTPEKMAEKIFAKYQHWRSPGSYNNLTYWENLNKIPAEIYGIEKQYVKSLDGASIKGCIEKFIQNRIPVIFSIGTVSRNGGNTTGHIALLRGFFKDGCYIINDPWGQPSNPFGLVNTRKSEIRGFYTAKETDTDILFGKGNGDNCILTEETFSACTGKKTEEGKLFNGAMTIVYPYVYSFPIGLHKYGLDDCTYESIYSNFKGCCNFLLSDNGLILRSLRMKKQENKEVHSVTAGRIVAVRNSKEAEHNFVLVQYRVPGNEKKYFYVCYRHLQYIDVEREVKSRLFSENRNTAAKDYLSQLIRKVSPKKGIYEKRGESTGSFHSDLQIPERGYAYFYPVDKKLLDYLFDFRKEDHEYNYKLNDIESYEVKKNGEKFYQVYAVSDVKSVSPENFIPQSMNYREFSYYRKKLKSLSEGKITYFCDDEHLDAAPETDVVNKDNYKDYFIKDVKAAFYNIEFKDESYSRILKTVENHYIDKIEKSSPEKLTKIWNDFENKCKFLCKTVLETPWEDHYAAFKLEDRWFKGVNNPDDFVGVKDVYNKVWNTFEPVYDRYNSKKNNGAAENKENNNAWKLFCMEVSEYYPANIDGYIEASPFTVLGLASSDISFECFSEENLYKNAELLEVQNLSKSDNIKALEEKGIIEKKDFSIEHGYLTPSDAGRIQSRIMSEYRNIVLCMKNPFIIEYGKEFNRNIDKAEGYTERDKAYRTELEFKALFPEAIVPAMKLRFSFTCDQRKFYFYNIMEFLNYMQEQNKHFTEGIINER